MKKKNGKKKVVGIVIAIVAVIGVVGIAGGILGSGTPEMAEGEETIQVQTYKMHDLTKSINVSGTVESQNVLTVATDLTCKVKELNVSLGDYVNEGDVLCVLDDSQIREAIETLESQVSDSEKLAAKQNEIAKRNLTQAQDNRDKAVANAKELADKARTEYNDAVNKYNALPDKNTDEALLLNQQIKSLETALKEAEKNIETVQSSANELVQSAQDTLDLNSISNGGNSEATKELSELYRQLEGVKIVAGQSGVITVLNTSQGSISNGMLMQIEDNKNLKIKVGIKEKDIIYVTDDMVANVTSDALPDEKYSGRVSKVINFSASAGTSNMATAGTGIADSGYSAEIIIEGDTNLLLGMSAKVEIILEDNGSALSLPYDSIIKEENGTYVYKASKSSENNYKIEKVSVTSGKDSGYYTEVTSDSLSEGDLVVNYPNQVSVGEEVRVNIHDAED